MSGCLQSGITRRPPETLDNNFALEALSFVDTEDEAQQLGAPYRKIFETVSCNGLTVVVGTGWCCSAECLVRESSVLASK